MYCKKCDGVKDTLDSHHSLCVVLGLSKDWSEQTWKHLQLSISTQVGANGLSETPAPISVAKSNRLFTLSTLGEPRSLPSFRVEVA